MSPIFKWQTRVFPFLFSLQVLAEPPTCRLILAVLRQNYSSEEDLAVEDHDLRFMNNVLHTLTSTSMTNPGTPFKLGEDQTIERLERLGEILGSSGQPNEIKRRALLAIGALSADRGDPVVLRSSMSTGASVEFISKAIRILNSIEPGHLQEEVEFHISRFQLLKQIRELEQIVLDRRANWNEKITAMNEILEAVTLASLQRTWQWGEAEDRMYLISIDIGMDRIEMWAIGEREGLAPPDRTTLMEHDKIERQTGRRPAIRRPLSVEGLSAAQKLTRLDQVDQIAQAAFKIHYILTGDEQSIQSKWDRGNPWVFRLNLIDIDELN